MTEREWFAVQDPLALLAFVQECSGVALLEGPPPAPRGGLQLPELPPAAARGPIAALYRSPTGATAPDPRQQREAELVRRLHRYLLMCCRAIWPLLPDEGSRRGVEVAELFVDGRATEEEFFHAEWGAEGAAFSWEQGILLPVRDFPDDPPFMARYNARKQAEFDQMSPEERDDLIRRDAAEVARIAPVLREVAAIPAATIRRMVRVPVETDTVSLRRILERAAYFAHKAIMFPGIHPRAGVVERYPEFLSADLLRRAVRYPLHAQLPGPGHVWWARYGTKA